jgi:hypothetical protein
MIGPWRDGNAELDPNIPEEAHARKWGVVCLELYP